MQTVLTHTAGMAFDLKVDGHTIPLDAAPEHGGQDSGPRPKPLLLAALGGCTGMDVASILAKMRQSWTKLEVRVDAELTDEHPRVFRDFTVVFDVEGDVRPDRLQRAVLLSRDQYCGVSAMLKAHAPVIVKVFLNGEELALPAG
ncbi:MAG: OsmC family protein [Alphaproteobacteria bacterium]|nr:OsmC family protein [Alphaproteobacteria bacterium]